MNRVAYRWAISVCSAMMAVNLFADMSGPELISEVEARSQIRESQLPRYSAVRIYEVKNAAGHVQGRSKVLVRYDWPNAKEFQVLEEEGSHAVEKMVFHPLFEREEKASTVQERERSAISPANYEFELTGEDELDGRRCYVLSATPHRRDKNLFEGTIWVDAQDLAIVQIEGAPAKNPSFWVKNVHFVRRYQKIGGYWLPREDTSVSDVKLFGRHTLTIQYEHYALEDQASR